MAYKLSEEEESRAKQLEKFRGALRRWRAASDAEEREDLRSFINGLIDDTKADAQYLLSGLPVHFRP